MIKVKGFEYMFDEGACKKCGALCCKGEGYVILSEDEIESISNYLKITVDKFVRLYTKKVEYGKKDALVDLKIAGETRCVFLNADNKCEIYAVRPKQCRTFPFWKNLKNKNIKELQRLCPGVVCADR